MLKLGSNWVQHEVGRATFPSDAHFIFTPQKPFSTSFDLDSAEVSHLLLVREMASCIKPDSFHNSKAGSFFLFEKKKNPVSLLEQSRVGLSNCGSHEPWDTERERG